MRIEEVYLLRSYPIEFLGPHSSFCNSERSCRDRS
jgi:hypothetical protein